MITSPPAGPPPYPPSPVHLPPAPAAPARKRRAAVVGVVAVLVLALVSGIAVAWYMTNDDGGPLAGRPRVKDGAAGISYAIPEGWERNDKGGLINAFTSSVAMKGKATGADGEGGGRTVLAGRAGGIPQSSLRQQTERAARSNAEFFYPDGRSTIEESRATTVSDRPAHTVALKVNDRQGHTAHLRMTLVSVDDSRAAFLLGVTQPAGPAERREVDSVLESASLM
ncbi:hypothetical protein WEB32_03745 [Streptomyces netropsis]|uniref:Uncharacterized protein n=1 Tax=Streptomyces netropsis TaxID=55404 RepID=A0A7W7LBU7_STRNE|nr:hypothetical protein [Streptomyces netropsis]MBB4887290.1 hypothetical protein [Streptomyces netropsis]